MNRVDEARERCMEALDAWYESRSEVNGDEEEELFDTYAALKRAQNGEPEDD